MEQKHHWLLGFLVVVLIVVAIVQGNMVHDLRQRVARLETGMSGVSQQMTNQDTGTSMGPSTPSSSSQGRMGTMTSPSGTSTNSSTNMYQPNTNTDTNQ